MNRVGRDTACGVLALGVAIVLSGCRFPSVRIDDTSHWSEYSSEELGFSVRFPNPPTEQRRTTATRAGQMELNVFVSESRDGQSAYLVVCAQYPKAILHRMTVDELLDTTDDDATSRQHLDVVRFQPVSLGGVPGRALTITDSRNGGMVNEFRAYLVGSRLYTVGFTTRRRGDVTERARSFFETFRLYE